MSEEIEVVESEVEPTEAENTEAPSEKVEDQTEEVETTDEPKKEKEEGFIPWPKKAVNAMQRRDRTISALKAKHREAEAKLREYESKNTATDAPKEEDYETYGDYIKAATLHEVMQKVGAAPKADQQDVTTGQIDRVRVHEVGVKAAEYQKTIPDFQETFIQNMDILDSLSPEVQSVFFQPGVDAALAFYNLAKEGTLEQVAQMDQVQAAMYIARAQTAPKVAPKVTQAPKPMRGVSGVGQNKQPLSSQSHDDIVNWLKS